MVRLQDMLRTAADMIDADGLPTSDAILVWPAREDTVPPGIWAVVDPDDIDWVAFVPDKYCDNYIGWLGVGPFGCYGVSETPIAGGTVYEGHHS